MMNDSGYIKTVTDKVEQTISRYDLISEGARVLVAVSGGADSVCLLHLLAGMRDMRKYKLFAAHLNHGIRGSEADRDEKYVRALCESLSVRLYAEHADIPTIAKESGLSEEEAGRRARYAFFARICAENKIDVTATAHNKNDQAETVIMRLLRGSGTAGLRGIKYKREDGVVRPLLDVTREEIEGYCREAKLEYKTDSTNLDDGYTRNKIRHTVIPALCEINPNAVGSIVKCAAAAGEDADFIDGYVRRLQTRLGAPILKSMYKALDIESLGYIKSRAIVSRLIIFCAADAMGDDYSLERKHLDIIINYAKTEGSGSLSLPGGLRVIKRDGWLEFRPPSDAEYNNSGEKGLNLYNNSEFCIEVEPDKLYNINNCSIIFRIKPITELTSAERKSAVDYDVIGGDSARLYIRNRRDGDRIAVYKNGRSRKLKKLFIDLKIPRDERESVPILCTEDNIISAVGVRVGEPYKITKRTEKALVIDYLK